MFKKGTKLYSILKNKCPKCHEGDFFKYKINLHPSKISSIHDNCSNCGQKYLLEPSFYYGAMYVSYALTIAISVAAFIISKVFIGTTLLQSFAVIVVALLVLSPVVLRLSRIIWINLFVGYDKKSLNKTKTESISK